MGAGDANPGLAVFPGVDMLRPYAHDFADPRQGLQSEFENQPWLRSARPISPVLGNLGVSPAMVPFDLDFGHGDAGRRVFLHHGRDGLLKKMAERFEPTT